MNKTLIYIGSVLAVFVIIFFYAKSNITRNINGKFLDFNLSNISGLFPTTADIDIKFNIINTSYFSFKITGFKVKIYDNETNEYLTENSVIQELDMPIGTTTHNVSLINNEVVGNLNDFLNGSKEYRAEISFKVLGVPVEFQQLINL